MIAEVEEAKPEEIELATMVYPDDKYALVVIKKTKKSLTLAYIGTEGIKPASFHNSFPVFNHSFTKEEAVQRITSRTVKAYANMRGEFRCHGGVVPIRLGSAVYYRDYSD